MIYIELEKLQQLQAASRPKERLCPIVKAYVEFERHEDCSQALHQLAGRRYDQFLFPFITC